MVKELRFTCPLSTQMRSYADWPSVRRCAPRPRQRGTSPPPRGPPCLAGQSQPPARAPPPGSTRRTAPPPADSKRRLRNFELQIGISKENLLEIVPIGGTQFESYELH
eukprot:1194837-Prorocentrum_minimum.AAC.3